MNQNQLESATAPRSVVQQQASSPVVDAACDVADAIRDFVRDRQHVIRCGCDEMHKTAPLQAAAWKMVLTELDSVAEVCIRIKRSAMDGANAKNQATASTKLNQHDR